MKYPPTVIPGAVRKSEENNMALDVDSILRRIGQFGPFQIRILAMFLFIFFPITFQTLIMVFVAYEPPWMCAQQSESCLEFNRSSGRSAVYSTATKPSELYERRCTLERSDWKFANYNLYDGPHNTIVDEVKHTGLSEISLGSASFPSSHSSAVREGSSPLVSGKRSSWKSSDCKREQ